MKVIENSRQRLVFRLGIFFLHRIECIMDKAANKATVKRTVLFFPIKAKEFPLSDIADVALMKVSGSAGEAGAYESTFPMFVLTSSRRVTLGAGVGSDSERAVALMKNFLADKP